MFQKKTNDMKPAEKTISLWQWGRISLIMVLCLLSALSVVELRQTFGTYPVSGEKNGSAAAASELLPEPLSKTEQYRIIAADVTEKASSDAMQYVFPVYITVADKTAEFLTRGGTVAEILKEAGYTVDRHDMIQPSADAQVRETVYIDYTDIDYTEKVRTKKIAHKTKTVYSDKLEKGVEQIVDGKDGLEKTTYTYKKVNGKVVKRTKGAVKTVRKPVDTLRTVGTKPKAAAKKAETPTAKAVRTSESVRCVSTLKSGKPIELDANNVPVKYKKKMTVQATAYTHSGHRCATGVKPQPGYIAVNPNVIPYGTKMYIVSTDGRIVYGYAIAADTGGFIHSRPTNVDLFYDTLAECYSFGRRNVNIYILP